MPNDDVNTGLVQGTKSKATIRFLIFYLLYIGVVLTVGAGLGGFQNSSLSPLKADLMTQSIVARPPNPPPAIKQLPNGILDFDKELKQTNIYISERQAHFTFNLTNISRQPVTIDGVETSCGCTVAQLPHSPWALKPREHGQIEVAVNVLPFIDTTRKSVTLITPSGNKTLMVEVSVLSDTNSTSRGLHP